MSQFEIVKSLRYCHCMGNRIAQWHCIVRYGIKVAPDFSSTHISVYAVKKIFCACFTKLRGNLDAVLFTESQHSKCQVPADWISSKDGFMQGTSSVLDLPAHVWIIYSDAQCLNRGVVSWWRTFWCRALSVFSPLLHTFSGHLGTLPLWVGELGPFSWLASTAYLQPGGAY